MDTPHPMVARSGEDLLAMLPVLFGFQPEESLVLVAPGPARPMQARVDLGRTSREVAEGLTLLLEPARQHGIERVVMYVLTDLTAAERWHERVVTACADRGIEVLEVIGADGERWRSLGTGATARSYDVWSHPFVAQAVLEGRVILPSRAALEATVEPDPTLVARVRAQGSAGPVTVLDPVGVCALVEEHATAGTLPGPREIAVLLASVQEDAARVEVAASTTRTAARSRLGVWSAVVRAAPEDCGGPAAVLAFEAWLAGEGALAWCAVDRARRARSGRECPLAGVVALLLERAVRPDTWDEWREGTGAPG